MILTVRYLALLHSTISVMNDRLSHPACIEFILAYRLSTGSPCSLLVLLTPHPSSLWLCSLGASDLSITPLYCNRSLAVDLPHAADYILKDYYHSAQLILHPFANYHPVCTPTPSTP